MKFYSELTKKLYDSDEACRKDEAEVQARLDAEVAAKKKKAAERGARAKEVEAAYAEAEKAKQAYNDLLNAFVKDYGSFHMTVTNPNDIAEDMFDTFARLFGLR